MAEERIAPARLPNQAMPARPFVQPMGPTRSVRSAGPDGPFEAGAFPGDLDLQMFGLPLALPFGPDVVDASEAESIVAPPSETHDREEATAVNAWRFALAQMHRATPSCSASSGEHGTLYENAPTHATSSERFSLWQPGLGGIDVHSYHDIEGWKILLQCDDEHTYAQLAKVLPTGTDPARLTLHVESTPRTHLRRRDADTSDGY